jgi:hypothetical protein
MRPRERYLRRAFLAEELILLQGKRLLLLANERSEALFKVQGTGKKTFRVG